MKTKERDGRRFQYSDQQRVASRSVRSVGVVMSRSRFSRSLVGLVAVSALAIGVTACGGSKGEESDAARTASTSDCPARFGCAKNPAAFTVTNNSDVAITLSARNFTNVKDNYRSVLTFTVPARSTSPVKGVYLGDEGLQSESGYIPGGYRGWWIWDVQTDTSRTPARASLAVNEDFELGMELFEGWSQVGPPVGTTWESTTRPVNLNSTTGVPTWSAVGSFVESYDESSRPVMSWTFTPIAP